jgi:glycosyltransferase involved in cell wall biosynthesis
VKTLLFEQWQGGHYFNYLECLIPALAEFSGEVVAAVTERAAASELFARQLAPLTRLANVRFDPTVPFPAGSGLVFRRQLGTNLLAAIDRHRPDFVFLPSADEQLLALPLLALARHRRGLRDVAIEAVIHYPSYTQSAGVRQRVVGAAQRGLLRSGVFSQLHFVNYLQYEDVQAQRWWWQRRARAAGDPVPQPPRLERRAARVALGLDPEGRYLGMIGGLDARKSVPATLAAFRAAKLPHTDRFLLAGRMTPEYAKLVREDYADLLRNGTLVVLDRFLSDPELAQGFAALDVHCSVSHCFAGLSSLMLKSIAAGVPVVVGDQPGWMRATVRRFDVGHVADHRSVAAFARVLIRALDAGDGALPSEAVGRLLGFHSIANFTEGLVERASVSAGTPPPTAVLPWSWVVEALAPERRLLR